ncbi:hypothetical protein ASA1KI_28890 [Opitutales bacterium ASA1]|uniref:DUF2868 domain-containing protein n=1 Tax=Congregicoccus parvus TaxID=3081749 RepID=UPI002B28DB72|nr:hypothetical protein ASA1KI_28890 [Opitutales bacterium ASA1]
MGLARKLFEDLRLALALRALERADGAGDFLPAADRRAWSREAGLDGLPAQPGPARMVRKLGERARIANGRRLPWTVRPLLVTLSRCDLPAWSVPVVAIAAFIGGVSSMWLGAERSVNLLALPLLGLLAWNAAVYLWLLGGVFSRPWRRGETRGYRPARVLAWWGERTSLVRLGRERRDAGGADGWRTTLAYARRAVEAWREAFPQVAGSIVQARFAAMLHLAACVWACGAIVGLYQQGWARSYAVYWESTLLDVGDVERIFGALFAPASAVLGIETPVEDLARIQTVASTPAVEGAPARAWFHLYAGTLALLVAMPRAVLAGLAWSRSRFALVRAVRAPLLREYFEEVRHGTDKRTGARTWNVALPDWPEERIAAVSAEAIRWGGERELFDRLDLRKLPTGVSPETRRATLAGVHALSFGAERTPDDEVRELLAIVRETASASAEPRVVFLDAALFRDRFADLPAAEDRWREREAAWREAVGGDRMTLVVLRADAVPPVDSGAVEKGASKA